MVFSQLLLEDYKNKLLYDLSKRNDTFIVREKNHESFFYFC